MWHWRTGGLLAVAVLACHTALADSGLAEQIERAQQLRGQQEVLYLNERAMVLPPASLERSRSVAEGAAGADRRWRELLGAQQRERAVPGALPSSRPVRALTGERADRADALSRQIRQQDLEYRSGHWP